MDAEIIRVMLNELKETSYLGAGTGQYSVGNIVIYALEKGLVRHTDDGNLQLSEKGSAFLDNTLSWEII